MRSVDKVYRLVSIKSNFRVLPLELVKEISTEKGLQRLPMDQKSEIKGLAGRKGPVYLQVQNQQIVAGELYLFLSFLQHEITCVLTWRKQTFSVFDQKNNNNKFTLNKSLFGLQRTDKEEEGLNQRIWNLIAKFWRTNTRSIMLRLHSTFKTFQNN